jgi:GT2 family glycosyltransferase
MDCSIIIINYKSTQLVLDCVASIYAQTNKYSFEIIVVDNDSKDDCGVQLQTHFPDVIWLPLDYNSGFARANNAGMEIAKGRYMLILNADTIILNNAIDLNIQLMDENKDAVGCGIQLLNNDGSNQISGAHFVKGGLNTLLPLPYIGRLVRYLGYTFKTTVPSVQTVNKTIAVDWVVGAYMLIRKDVLPQSGLFDADFFMYAEEIEWCSRLRKQGKLLLFSEPKIIHIGGGTSSDYYNTSENENSKNLWNRKGRQIIISNMLRIRKQFGVGWWFLMTAAYSAEIPFFAICLLVDKIIHRGKGKYTWRNWKDYTDNIIVLLGYFFKMLRNKPYFYKVA